jgi:hypothetical protein
MIAAHHYFCSIPPGSGPSTQLWTLPPPPQSLLVHLHMKLWTPYPVVDPLPSYGLPTAHSSGPHRPRRQFWTTLFNSGTPTQILLLYLALDPPTPQLWAGYPVLDSSSTASWTSPPPPPISRIPSSGFPSPHSVLDFYPVLGHLLPSFRIQSPSSGPL